MKRRYVKEILQRFLIDDLIEMCLEYCDVKETFLRTWDTSLFPTTVSVSRSSRYESSSNHNPSCFIYVSGYTFISGRVSQETLWTEIFTPAGKLILRLPYIGNIPSLSAISPLGFIYIISLHYINVYNLKGEYLRMFGRPGNKEGEFDRPESIAVSQNGEIYIADTRNVRIQVFGMDLD